MEHSHIIGKGGANVKKGILQSCDHDDMVLLVIPELLHKMLLNC